MHLWVGGPAPEDLSRVLGPGGVGQGGGGGLAGAGGGLKDKEGVISKCLKFKIVCFGMNFKGNYFSFPPDL